jgi:hypothetical protein
VNHTDVQAGCTEVLRNYHKFEFVGRYLVPHFQKTNFPSQEKEEREFAPRWRQLPWLYPLYGEDSSYKGGFVPVSNSKKWGPESWPVCKGAHLSSKQPTSLNFQELDL